MNLPLSENIYNQLRVIHNQIQIKRKNDADRLKIILLSHAGYTQKEIESILLMNENTINYWIKNSKNCTNMNDWSKKTAYYTGVRKLPKNYKFETKYYFSHD